MSVAAPRIGTGVGFFVAGGAFMALAAFGGLAGQGAFAGMCAALGGSLIAVGFWVRLFGMVERRLIDIERRIAGVPDAPGATASPAPAGQAADTYLG